LAFFFKKVNGKAVFSAAIITQIIVIAIFYFGIYQLENNGSAPVISYLWLNFIGCILVLFFALVFVVKRIDKYSKITLAISLLAIAWITWDIFNTISLNLYHVFSLIILFTFLGYFNIEKPSRINYENN
jgi:hypothetical protein